VRRALQEQHLVQVHKEQQELKDLQVQQALRVYKV
jgi:hypothetical protein